MRIQHNIMAMNAYRNYTNNVSAMKANLEKLSSGYKINRAGDDAAGLAISEKMRAQITGLQQAQNNAKSGINLVQTAEGALQEVHDMLNRMVKLADQSANGTYDNDVDRVQLQKEVTQLLDEIDRIADSANFNGQKLLNGELDDGALDAVKAATGNFDIPATGKLQDDLGVKTITHTSAVQAGMVQFGVELGDLEFSHGDGESVEISIGDYKIQVGDGAIDSVAQGTKITAKNIVNAFVAATDNNGEVKGADGLVITAAGEVTINGIAFDVEANAAGTGLVFTQTAAGEIDGDMAVEVTGTTNDAVVPGTVTGDITTKTVDETTAPADGAKAKYTYDFTGVTDLTAGSYTVGVAGQSVTVTLEDGAATLGDLLNAVKTEVDGKVADGMDDSFYKVTVAGNTLVFEAGTAGDATTQNTAVTGDASIAAAAEADAGYVKGTYNKQTTETAPSAAGAEKNLASTVITLDAAKMSNGSKVVFGETKYTFTTDEADKTATTANADNKVYVGDLDLTTDSGLKAAIDRLSVVAADNEVWSVGYAGSGGKVTVTEKYDAATDKGWLDQAEGNKKKFDLTTVDGIKKSLGFETAAQDAVAGDPTKGLKLQIGDTSDSFNQLRVAIKDMHTSSLKIADVDISTQEGAAAAVDIIKNAINMVSDVRGTLGATQNRLDHTINNLSVMTENIQDAESTIRDTDVAEEMMAYTKNNILIQSAQAMLAQANQVPQGVLQLLG